MSTIVGCYECGLPYGSNAWADVVVPDAVWRLISPTKDDSGLLCFNCMNNRLTELKLRNVPYYIVSGPFSFSVRDTTQQTREAMVLAERESSELTILLMKFVQEDESPPLTDRGKCKNYIIEKLKKVGWL